MQEAVFETGTCLGCGYPLLGLTSPTCPECGRAFDPSDPESFDGPMRAVRRLRRALHWAPIAVWAATVGAVLSGTYILAREFDIDLANFLWHVPSLLFIGALLLAGWTRRWALRALLGAAIDPHPHSERSFGIVTWLACVLLLFSPGGVRQWSCPHGSGFGLGPIGVAKSTVGGPCRNTVNWDEVWHVAGTWYVWVEIR